MFASVRHRRDVSPIYTLGSPDPVAFSPGASWTEKEWAEVDGQQVWALSFDEDEDRRNWRLELHTWIRQHPNL